MPAPLPTTAEILASKEILKGVEAWADRKVVGVGEHFIVKFGAHNDQVEGDNRLFLEQNNCGEFAPRLYAMWKAEDGKLYLVMERLRGKTLECLWPALREAEKSMILSKIKMLFTKLRAIPHRGFFGSVDETKSRLIAEQNQRQSHLADFFEQCLSRDLVDNRPPVFMHSDLQRKNLLIETDEKDKSCLSVKLVDWEYVAAFFAFKWDGDWCTRVSYIIDAWPAEIAMKMIYQDLWF
ncbi:hypothetical protein BJ878DRAFT_533671 [Calycina marina]|uniref:Aminoglycoside phosphotransferase domain-containing protein n=1 Tax=Calycina marina TaxID=1763456 RepID=A0A9P7Z536_9HELO|nr:hypothetical protein BJ878DRAFT_533671 [Calycina marina]